jgi:hypothetical protein
MVSERERGEERGGEREERGEERGERGEERRRGAQIAQEA